MTTKDELGEALWWLAQGNGSGVWTCDLIESLIDEKIAAFSTLASKRIPVIYEDIDVKSAFHNLYVRGSLPATEDAVIEVSEAGARDIIAGLKYNGYKIVKESDRADPS